MTMISLYSKASDTKNGKDIPLDIFLDHIREGKWQDMVLPISAMADKDDRDAAKKRVPYVTISGKVSGTDRCRTPPAQRFHRNRH
jgi:hypothetical protein